MSSLNRIHQSPKKQIKVASSSFNFIS